MDHKTPERSARGKRLDPLDAAVAATLRGLAAKEGIKSPKLALLTGISYDKIKNFFILRSALSLHDMDAVARRLGTDIQSVITSAKADLAEQRSRRSPTVDESLMGGF